MQNLTMVPMMQKHKHNNYARIEKAIQFIRQNFKSQPSLEEIAEAIHVSPYHFQRMFREWAGVSPKKFVQYLSIEHAQRLLKQPMSLMDTALETGLSGTGRLHDLFVAIEGMTPGEYKNGGECLTISYSYTQSPFGKVIVASAPKGICHLAFNSDEGAALSELQTKFPNAVYRQATDIHQQSAIAIFHQDWSKLEKVKLHLAASPFQIKVWESLLKVPAGVLSTYGDIAVDIGNNKAARAVGNAVANNPIAYLIPCHRVIQSNGSLGGYRWGQSRKSAIIGWESAKLESPDI